MLRRLYSSAPVITTLSAGSHPKFQVMKRTIDDLFKNKSVMQSQISKLYSLYNNEPKLDGVEADFLNSALYFSAITCKSIPSAHITACQHRIKEIQRPVLLSVCEKLLRSNNWPVAEKLIAAAFEPTDGLFFKFEVFARSGYFSKMKELLSNMHEQNLLPIEVIKWTNALMSLELSLKSLTAIHDASGNWKRLLYLILKGRILSADPPSVEKTVEAIGYLKSVVPEASTLLRVLFIKKSSIGNVELTAESITDAVKTRDLLFLALKLKPSKFSYNVLLKTYSRLVDNLIARTALSVYGSSEGIKDFLIFCLENKIALPQKQFAQVSHDLPFDETFMDLAHSQNLFFSRDYYERNMPLLLQIGSHKFYKCVKIFKKQPVHGELLLQKALELKELEIAHFIHTKLNRKDFSTDQISKNSHYFVHNGVFDGKISGNYNLFKELFDWSGKNGLIVSQQLCQKGMEMALLKADFFFAEQLRAYMNNLNYCDSKEKLVKKAISLWRNKFK